MKSKIKISLFLTMIIFLFTINTSQAKVTREEEVHGNAFGSWAQGFMIAGTLFIIIIKSLRHLKRRMRTHPETIFNNRIVKPFIDVLSTLDRKKLLTVHKITMTIGLILGCIHGISMLSEGNSYDVFTGIILGILMLILSLSGILLWIKSKIYWKHHKFRLILRTSHINFFGTMLFNSILVLHGG